MYRIIHFTANVVYTLVMFRTLPGRELFFLERVEDILVNHVATGIMKAKRSSFSSTYAMSGSSMLTPGTWPNIFSSWTCWACMKSAFGISRADFLALAAVHAGVGDVGEPDQVEHEVDRKFAGRDIGRVLGPAVNTVADRAVLDAW